MRRAGRRPAAAAALALIVWQSSHRESVSQSAPGGSMVIGMSTTDLPRQSNGTHPEPVAPGRGAPILGPRNFPRRCG
jgi:hypothetical protein